MSIRLEELYRLQLAAQSATPGPWTRKSVSAWDDGEESVAQASVGTPDGLLTWDDHGGEVFKVMDADYIAAFNPETAKRLIEEILRLKEITKEND